MNNPTAFIDPFNPTAPISSEPPKEAVPPQIKERVQEAAHEAQDRAQEVLNEVRQRAHDLTSEAEIIVKNNPVQTLLAAFGIGFVLAFALRR